MASKVNTIPDNMTIEEASDFWDTHSVADYTSHIVELKYAPKGRITFVALADEVLVKVKEQAKKQGVSVETLVNLWVKDKLTT